MMEFFPHILSMSISASLVAVAVILMRVPMKRLPKICSYLLWAAVGFRFTVPAFIHSNFSLQSLLTFAVSQAPESGSATLMSNSVSGDAAVGMLTNVLDANVSPVNSVNPSQIAMWAAGWIWAVGIVVLLVISATAYMKIRRTVETAVLVRSNIYESDQIGTPFVLGFLHPRIYIPIGIQEEELSYILLHEQTHIDRKDHLIKTLAHLIVIMHWFNPMAWLSFALMSKDMEMSCDERVLREMGATIKTDYSKSLLSLSIKQSGMMKVTPLGFGESHIKSRIKNILTYRNPALWVVVMALGLTSVAMVSLMTNPKMENSETVGTSPLKMERDKAYDYIGLVASRTAYVGNNSKVVALADRMMYPSNAERGPVQLKTKQKPYGVVITFFMKEQDLKAFKDTEHMFEKNGILMLALIDNAEFIEFVGVPSEKKSDYENSGLVVYSVHRQGVESTLGEKLSDYGENADKIAELLGNAEKAKVIGQ